MTDRELLELAAKAADIMGIDGVFPIGTPDGQWRPWNPLTDDGDALRLAVKLVLQLGRAVVDGKREFATCALDDEELWEPIGDDPYAATRRVIVLAAAEIGKQKDTE